MHICVCFAYKPGGPRCSHVKILYTLHQCLTYERSLHVLPHFWSSPCWTFQNSKYCLGFERLNFERIFKEFSRTRPEISVEGGEKSTWLSTERSRDGIYTFALAHFDDDSCKLRIIEVCADYYTGAAYITSRG
ncbi:hypothetical protein BDR07DRAFT_793862 [Suillus spraguei]|nr:hypothetical protein BDR07DRAFT_793862 [Suillus spraguei]